MKTVVGRFAFVIFGATAILWGWNVFRSFRRLTAADFWFLLLLLVIPSGLVVFSLWVMIDRAWWRRVVGALILLPALAIWILTMMFAHAGFRIH